MRIGILGIGGVGAYIGGYLAKAFPVGSGKEVIFIARGKHAEVIQSEGLQIASDEGVCSVKPTIVSDHPEVIGKLDVLICATKTYDLQEALTTYSSCISSETILLPLLNGVDAVAMTRMMFPLSTVLDGCIFIVSKLTEPGKVLITGTNHYVCIGSEKEIQPKVDTIEGLFQEAGIKYKRTENILQAVWEKYSFIAPLASLTTFKDHSIGQILENEEEKELLLELMREVKSLAKAKGIDIDNSILERNIAAMEKMPYETTASMHRDVRAGKKYEYESLTGYVVTEGEKLEVATPIFRTIYEEFQRRNKQ